MLRSLIIVLLAAFLFSSCDRPKGNKEDIEEVVSPEDLQDSMAQDHTDVDMDPDTLDND